MNIIFPPFLFLIFGVIQLLESSDVKFPSFDSKSLEVSQSNRKLPDGPFCKSIVAYFVGTLQNKNAPEQSQNIQFQLKLWANEKDDKVHVKMEHWNEVYSSSKDFELDFYYDGNRQRCKIHDNLCVSSFAKKTANFTLDLNTKTENYFHLLNFNNFNNSFGLYDSRDKCTKHQLDNLNDNYVPNSLNDRLNYCVCCDDYEPNLLLGCPIDNWKGDKKTTQKPTQSPLQPKNITCNEVVGYYNGIFQASYQPKISNNVEFQVRLLANGINRRVHFTVDQWNENKAKMSDFTPYTFNNELNPDWNNNKWMGCNPIKNPNCSIHYVTQTEPYFFLFLWYHPDGLDSNYNFLFFPQFNNTFTLTNAIGQCTKHQVHDPNFNEWGATNESLYEYCICCGNQYKPDPALKCPKNPWA